MLRKTFAEKRGQVGETMTWVFATVIIIAMVLIFVFLASVLGVLGGANSGKTVSPSAQFDLFAEKSLTGYLLTNGSSGGSVYADLRSAGNFNDENGNLAASIFKTLYGGHYPSGIYLGFYDSSAFISADSNKFFGAPPNIARRKELGGVLIRQGVEEALYVDGKKFLHLVLAGGYS